MKKTLGNFAHGTPSLVQEFTPFSGGGAVSFPAGYTTATIECIGAGGQAIYQKSINNGGNGGNYSKSVVSLAGHSSFNLTIPAAGGGTQAAFENGSVVCYAKSGTNSNSPQTTSQSVIMGPGSVTYAGGTGATNAGAVAGGGAAGPTGPGGDAISFAAGGTGRYPGGDGGSAANQGGTAQLAGKPYGGGSAIHPSFGQGAPGSGYVRITWS